MKIYFFQKYTFEIIFIFKSNPAKDASGDCRKKNKTSRREKKLKSRRVSIKNATQLEKSGQNCALKRRKRINSSRE